MGRFDPLPTNPDQHRARTHDAQCAACREATKLGTRFCTNCNAFRDDVWHGQTIRYATSRWMRFGARLVDTAIISGISAAAFFILESAGLFGFDVSDVYSIRELDLYVSWLIGTGIWFFEFVALASRGQTPGKWIVRTKVVGVDGGDVSASRMRLREVTFQIILPLSIAFEQFLAVLFAELFTQPILTVHDLILALLVHGGIFVVADGVQIFFSPDRQTIHDRIFGTLVVNA